MLKKWNWFSKMIKLKYNNAASFDWCKKKDSVSNILCRPLQEVDSCPFLCLRKQSVQAADSRWDHSHTQSSYTNTTQSLYVPAVSSHWDHSHKHNTKSTGTSWSVTETTATSTTKSPLAPAVNSHSDHSHKHHTVYRYQTLTVTEITAIRTAPAPTSHKVYNYVPAVYSHWDHSHKHHIKSIGPRCLQSLRPQPQTPHKVYRSQLFTVTETTATNTTQSK